MARPKLNKGRYNFLIDKAVYTDFSKICDELGFVRGKKLENFMKEFINQNKDILKEVKK